MEKVLEIIETRSANTYTSTGIASTAYAVRYRFEGEEKECAALPQEEALVLTVDGVQQNLIKGKAYEVKENFQIRPVRVLRIGGPSAAPWSGASEEEKVTYYYRQALLSVDGKVVPEASVTEAIVGGSYDGGRADQIRIRSEAPHFNGITLEGSTQYEITDSDFYAYGDGSDDLSGWAAMVAAYDTSTVKLSGCYMETAGCCRPALYVGDTAQAEVKDSVLYSQETQDSYEEFRGLVPAMMKRVPFALGMEGAVRTLNVMGAGQGKFEDCIVVSTGWGALSTDSGTAYDNCGTYAIRAKDTLSGIGTLEIAEEGKEYTARKTVNGVEYGFRVGGSGYVTYADSGVHNQYDHCEFYSPDYIQVFGSGRSGSFYTDCYLLAQHSAFMTQQSGGGILSLKDTTVDLTDSLLQIKSGKANTGFSHLEVDHSEIRFSGTSTRAANGILCELVESDDAGNPGIMVCTLSDHPEEAKATGSTLSDSTAVFKNGSYRGDIYNSIYQYRQLLDVTAEQAQLEGVISSSVAYHVDFQGNRVPNGTVLHAYEGSEEYDTANYLAAPGGSSMDYALIGRFSHTASEQLNNPVNLTLRDSVWRVTGDCYLNAVVVDCADALRADEPVSVHVKAFTAAGTPYEDGTYSLGQITLIVDSTVIEAEDNGVADAGQTYGNVAYTFLCEREDGTLDSGAVTVKRQNFIDGNLYFALIPADGYEIVSVTARQGSISENTSVGELEAYTSVLAPEDGAREMSVTVAVTKK